MQLGFSKHSVMIRVTLPSDLSQRAQVLFHRFFLAAAACLLAWPGTVQADVSFEGVGVGDGDLNNSPDVRAVSTDGSSIVGRGRTNGTNGYYVWKDGVVSFLPDLPGSTVAPIARGLNADGTVVVGSGKSSIGDEAAKWVNGVIEALGPIPAGGWTRWYGYYANADASVIYGTVQQLNTATTEIADDYITLPFRWTQPLGAVVLDLPVDTEYRGMVGANPTGTVLLLTVNKIDGVNKIPTAAILKDDGSSAVIPIPMGYTGLGSAMALSADGLVVVGELTTTGNKENRAFKWTEAGGVEILSMPAPSTPGALQTSKANQVSADGSFILGSIGSNATRWSTLARESLGSFTAQLMTADGGVVIGRRTSVGRQELVMWDPFNGLRALGDVFMRQFQGMQISRWQDLSASFLTSDNGIVTMTGNGENPNGFKDIWVAKFPAPTEVEPEPFSGDLFVRTATTIPSLKFSENYKDAVVNITKPPAAAAWEQAATYRSSLTATVPIEGIDLTSIDGDTPLELALGAFGFSGKLSDDPAYTPTKKTATIKLPDSAGTVKATWDARRLTVTVTLSIIDKPTVPNSPFFSHSNSPAIVAPYYYVSAGTSTGLIDARLRFGDRTGRRAVYVSATYSTSQVDKQEDGTFRLSNIVATGTTDYTVPSLTFVSPADKAVVIGKTVPVVVGVSDNTALARVEIKLNNGSAISATKKTLVNKINGWVAEVTPIVGLNTVTAQAFDTSGNASAIITRKFTYVAKSGAYNGLLTDGGEFGRGTFYLTTTDAGGFSGKIILDGKTIGFKGNFSVGGNAVLSIPFGGGNLTLTLGLVVNGDDTSVVGTLKGGVIDVAFNGGRSIYDGKSTLAPQTGSYTMLLPPDTGNAASPQAYGYATVTVATNGLTKFVGKLPDGSAWSFGATIDGKEQLPVFAALPYTVKGSLVGQLTFADVPSVSDFSGDLRWKKPVQATGFYKTGVDTVLSTIGSKVSTLNITTYGGNPDVNNYVPGTSELVFKDGNLAADVVAPVQVDKVLRFDGPPPNSMTLKMTVLTGFDSQLFSGTFKDGAKVRTFYGIVFGKQQVAAGYFLGNDEAGSLFLEPQP